MKIWANGLLLLMSSRIPYQQNNVVASGSLVNVTWVNLPLKYFWFQTLPNRGRLRNEYIIQLHSRLSKIGSSINQLSTKKSIVIHHEAVNIGTICQRYTLASISPLIASSDQSICNKFIENLLLHLFQHAFLLYNTVFGIDCRVV